jgi:hypothetical protein
MNRHTGAIWVESMRCNWHLSNRKDLWSGHGSAEDSAVNYCGRGWEQVESKDAATQQMKGTFEPDMGGLHTNLAWFVGGL